MASGISNEQRRKDLTQEYLFIQGQYEDYDKRSLTIKGWVSSGAVAALALAFNSSYGSAVAVPVIVAVVVAIVWYLEAHWKLFQFALADRIRVIEAYFRDDPDILVKNPDPFQIYSWWFRSYARDEPIYAYEKELPGMRRRPRTRFVRLTQVMVLPFVCLPYLPVIIICAVSAFILGMR